MIIENRNIANRRSEDELLKLQSELDEETYKLEEQEDFHGTEEELKRMQSIERAYIDGRAIISDEEWDLLKKKFNYKESLISISPSGRTWVKMSAPLVSIAKESSLDGVKEFLNKFADRQEFQVEAKLDGLTVTCFYKLSEDRQTYKFQYAGSRGNGLHSLKFWDAALYGVNTDIPRNIDTSIIKKIYSNWIGEDFNEELPELFELRGEGVIPKNDITEKKYGKNAVLRSIASGIVNRKIPANIDGIFLYLTNGQKNLQQMCFEPGIGDSGTYSLETKFEGRTCINPETAEAMKLIYSLISEEMWDNGNGFKPSRNFKGDKITVCGDGYLCYKRSTGEKFECNAHDYDEYFDVVFYSCTINGSNIDTEDIKLIPGIKTIEDVCTDRRLEEKDQRLFYKKTANRNEIIQMIADFYGLDLETFKRNYSKLRLRNCLEYACDGVVLKPVGSDNESQVVGFRNSKNNPNKIIFNKYPEDTLAFKALSEMVKVKLERIETDTTDLGNITCTGILDREYLTESGAYVSRVNLFNPEWLEVNDWIKEGETYMMIMAYDFIPTLQNPKEFDPNDYPDNINNI